MFIDMARKCIDELDNVNDGVFKAVDECIEKDILKDYLLDNKSEVVAMCLVEFDQEKYESSLYTSFNAVSIFDDEYVDL